MSNSWKNSGCQWLGDGGNEEMLVKGYEVSVSRMKKFGDLMHSVVTVVNNTVCWS